MNNNNPHGLRPACYLNGAPYNGQVEEFYIPETDTDDFFVGDAVTLAGSASAEGIPTIRRAASGDALLGAVIGVSRAIRDDEVYRQGGQAMHVFVSTDANILYEIQEDSDGGALTADNVGQNAELLVQDGSDQGISGTELDSSTAATTAGHDLKIMRLVRREDNAIGENAKWLVKINNHQYADNEVGV